jgi:hypothetical protein
MVDKFDLQPKLLQRRNGISVPQVIGLLRSSEHKVVLQQPAALLGAVFCGSLSIRFFEVNYQTFLDAKDCVGCLVRIVSQVQRA